MYGGLSRMYVKRPNKNGCGRKSGFQPKMVEQAFRLSLLGLTNDQIANFFQVTAGQFQYWLQQHEDFDEAIRAGRIDADSKVAKSLYNRALGYTYEEPHVMVVERDGEKQVVITPITKVVPPDVQACIKWLSIRQREFWTEVQKVEHTNNVTIKLENVQKQLGDPNQFTDAELKLALKMGLLKATKAIDAGTN